VMQSCALWARAECLRKMIVHIEALMREYHPEEPGAGYVAQ